MKKFLFVVVALLLVSSMCFALESAPSNKVGYVKIDIPTGSGTAPSYTSFGLPFVFWTVPTGTNVPTYGTESRKPSSVIGPQAACGTVGSADAIMRQDNGQFAWRNGTACTWSGTLETSGTALMMPGRAYWYRNKSGTARTLILAGEADTTATGIPQDTIRGNSYCAYSWRDPRSLPVGQLNLRQAGYLCGNVVTSDHVIPQAGGSTLWCNATGGNAWGGPTTVEPGKAYWIQSKHATTWYYTYRANGQNITAPEATTLPASVFGAPDKPTKAITTGKVKLTSTK